MRRYQLERHLHGPALHILDLFPLEAPINGQAFTDVLGLLEDFIDDEQYCDPREEECIYESQLFLGPFRREASIVAFFLLKATQDLYPIDVAFFEEAFEKVMVCLGEHRVCKAGDVCQVLDSGTC